MKPSKEIEKIFINKFGEMVKGKTIFDISKMKHTDAQENAFKIECIIEYLDQQWKPTQ